MLFGRKMRPIVRSHAHSMTLSFPPVYNIIICCHSTPWLCNCVSKGAHGLLRISSEAEKIMESVPLIDFVVQDIVHSLVLNHCEVIFNVVGT